MNKIILLPLLIVVFSCTTDEKDEDTFTGLYDGYSWTLTEQNQGVNQASTYKNIIFIKDNEVNIGYIHDFTGEDDNCSKESNTIKEGTYDYYGDLAKFTYEVNSPEMLKIKFSYPEYNDEFETITLTVKDSSLIVEDNEHYNNKDHILIDVYIIDNTFKWKDFQDFKCPN